MDNKKKKNILIIAVLAFILLIVGGTYAFVTWSSNETQQTNVTFTVTPDFSCSADAGGHITSNDRMLAPTDCMDPEYAIQRTITTSSTTSNDKVISMDLWLNVNSVSANLLASNNFKYAITKNKNSCTSGIINSGVVKDDIVNNKINLLEGAEYATLSDTYYLYIWLDEAETNHNTMNQSFDFSIDGKCADTGLEATKMINMNWNNRTSFFKEDDYREKITDISFIYDKDLPIGITTNKIKTYDLGENTSKPITGYLINGDSEDTYKLYISSEYKIFAQRLGYAFNGMKALKNIIFDNFDTSKTTSMGAMFQDCSSLTNLDLSNFNTSLVTDMSYMFAGCNNLTTLNVSSFDTSKVTQFGNMFRGCSSLTSIDVSSFDTSNVTNMNSMFIGCSSLTSIDVSSFDTSNVTNMSYMFRDDINLTSLDLSTFDTSNVTNMVGMFQGSNKINYLNLSNFNTKKVKEMNWMFARCWSLPTLDLSSFNTSNVTNMGYMFLDCSALKNIYVSDTWTTGSVNISADMFFHDTKLPNYNSSVVDKTNAHYGEGGYLTYKAYN